MGDALTALDDLSNDLSTTLKQISDINAELANKDHIGLENAQQVCLFSCAASCLTRN